MTTASDQRNAAKKHKVLLVEDEAADIVLGKNRILDIWPEAIVTTVSSLGAAHRSLSQQDFDLILLDLNLPDAYGAATVKEIRKINKSTPIIVLTGMGTDITVSNAIKMGANHVTLKSQILDDGFKDILKQHVQ